MKSGLVQHIAVNDDKVGDVLYCIEGDGDGLIFHSEAGGIKCRIRTDNQLHQKTGLCIEGDIFNLTDNLSVSTHNTFLADIVGKLLTLHNLNIRWSENYISVLSVKEQGRPGEYPSASEYQPAFPLPEQ